MKKFLISAPLVLAAVAAVATPASAAGWNDAALIATNTHAVTPTSHITRRPSWLGSAAAEEGDAPERARGDFRWVLRAIPNRYRSSGPFIGKNRHAYQIPFMCAAAPFTLRAAPPAPAPAPRSCARRMPGPL